MPEYITKDSGERVEYSTGARRDTNKGKGRFDLIPPVVPRRYAELLERGAAKYGEHNWEKGIPVSRFFDSALRHLTQALDGQEDEDHLAAVIFNVGGIMFVREQIERGLLPPELDDMPIHKNGKAAAAEAPLQAARARVAQGN